MNCPRTLPTNMRSATIEVVENTLYVHCAETGSTLIRLTLPAALDARANDWRVTTDFNGQLQVSRNRSTIG